MRALKKPFQQSLAVFFFGSLLASVPVIAATDLEGQDGFANTKHAIVLKSVDGLLSRKRPAELETKKLWSFA